MADTPGNLPGQTANRTLDTATREQLLAVLQEKLAQASDDALARGMSPEDLAAQLDERIARLRAHIAEKPADSEPNET